VLVFDRGLPCAANFKKLLDDETGHLFLTSVKSDSIPSFVELDDARLDELQRLDADATEAEVNKACAKLQLDRYDKTTYARDVGLVQATKTNARKKDPLPPMRVYVYFNREIQLTKRERRQEKLDDLSAFVADLNETLANAKKSRTQNATHKKITRKLDRLSLSECFGVKLEPIDLAGKTKPIRSFRVHLEPREDMLRNMARRDGVTVLIAHPNVAYTVEEAIQAYRQKDVVEADFRTIKSVLDLRPVHHWKDEKVAAHVTICMLALLVERLLEARLGAHDDLTLPRTASALLEELEEVQLHRVVVNRKNHGGPTRATRRTKHLAKALTVTHLLAGPTTTATADRKVAV
jgi:transposase